MGKYPKEMLVSFDDVGYYKRWVLAKYNNKYICSEYGTNEVHAKGFMEGDTLLKTFVVTKAKELEPEIIHLTAKDISEGKGKGVSPELIRFKE